MGDLLVVVVVAVVVNVAWTLLVRTFPAVLTETLTKGIEHRYATRLSRLKVDWDARYSTLKSSVDFLSASQSDLRTRSISSVESLWTTVLEIERECRALVFVDSILTPKEIQDSFVSGRIKTLLGDFRDFKWWQRRSSASTSSPPRESGCFRVSDYGSAFRRSVERTGEWPCWRKDHSRSEPTSIGGPTIS